MNFSKTTRSLGLAACLAALGCGAPQSGSPPDGGQPLADAVLTPELPDAPRRGPIALSFDVVDRDRDLHGLLLSFQDGAAWKPATLLFEAHTPSSATYVWDSFADAPVDGSIDLRLVAKDGSREVSLPFSVEVRNDPSDDRLVLVGHNLADDGQGGATETGHSLSAFVWSGLAPGGVVGAPRQVDVGVGPTVMRAAPHGRATAVLEETDQTVSLVTTPLDALVDGVSRSLTVSLPYGTPMDLRWSADGRFLYVLGSASDDGQGPPALWRYFPSEDLAVMGEPTSLAPLPGPPMALAVDGAGHRLLVFCGSGGVTGQQDKLLLLGDDGHEIARLEGDFDPPGDLEISPAGDTALMTSAFGTGVLRFSLGADSIAQPGALIAVPNAQDIVFQPASTAAKAAALVSQLDDNTVTPLALTPEATTPGPALSGFPLSAEMDVIERGDEAGTVLVPGVSASTGHSLVQSAQLSLDGTATGGPTALDFGGGTENIPAAIAIQR